MTGLQGIVGLFLFLFLIFLAIYAIFGPRYEKRFKEEERRRKREFDIEERWRQGARIYEELKEQRLEEKRREEEMFLERPNSAFGICRENQISQMSSKEVNLHFAQYEVNVPKPHSILEKYYADVWEDNNQIRSIYGISPMFLLENQHDQQEEITNLFLRLKKQLTTKYGPDNHSNELTALLLTNEIQPKKFQNMDNLLYKGIYEWMEDKYTSLYGKDAFNPLMLRQITPFHASIFAEWNFSEGDIQQIKIGCRRFNQLTQGIFKRAEEKFPGANRLLFKVGNDIELTNEEKDLYERVNEVVREEERFFGDVCIYLKYSFRFSNEERNQRSFNFFRKNVIEKKFDGSKEDLDAL